MNFGLRPTTKSTQGADPGIQTKIPPDMLQYILHLPAYTKELKHTAILVIAKLFHDQYPQTYETTQARIELATPVSAVRLIRWNIISVSSGEVVVEIFLSDRVKPF